jgi:hypothetical protein
LLAEFDGGTISCDGGALLLRGVEARVQIISRAAQCFVDCRDPELIEHTVTELVGQRGMALALGYEERRSARHGRKSRAPRHSTERNSTDLAGEVDGAWSGEIGKGIDLFFCWVRLTAPDGCETCGLALPGFQALCAASIKRISDTTLTSHLRIPSRPVLKK